MASAEPVSENGEPGLTLEQLKSKFEQLKAAATQQYSLKNYSAAAESYSEAAEVQDEINGEMSPENADLLYQYGCCLYHVAVSRSDVLGGKVAATEEPKRKKRKVGKAEGVAGPSRQLGSIEENGTGEDQKFAEDVVEAVVEEKQEPRSRDTIASKPFFQITGDENWTDSEEEEGEDDAEAQDEEDDDDFAIAYEILDVARVLLMRKLGDIDQSADRGTQAHAEARQIKERLADTHDLQAEISLENERFHDAINDTRDSLQLKLELYPEESSLIAEAHFKLSLALEFASVTTTSEEGDKDAKPAQVDEEMRKESALEMEKAIASCRLRVSKEEGELATLSGAKAEERRKAILDVKDMIADMEQRLVDLRGPGVSLSAVSGPAGAPDGSDPLRGILGSILGESKAEQQKRVAEATATANDLTGLVKHKNKPTNNATPPVAAQDSKGKRKAEDDVETTESESGKKARMDQE